jgi:hypothetical protein
MAQYYYVFPQLRHIAAAMGLILNFPSGSAVPDSDGTEAYQEYGECILECSPDTVVPSGMGASCHDAIYDPDVGCVFNDFCEDRTQCAACCGKLIECSSEGYGGGGGGVACDIDDIYCRTLFGGSDGW